MSVYDVEVLHNNAGNFILTSHSARNMVANAGAWEELYLVLGSQFESVEDVSNALKAGISRSFGTLFFPGGHTIPVVQHLCRILDVHKDVCNARD